MPDVRSTTSVDHVALYERLVDERDDLIRALVDDAKRRPDAAAPAAALAQLSRMIHGARRITARMPGGAQLPFRPIAAASNTEAVALVRQLSNALWSFKQCYEDWKPEDEDEEESDGDFYWRLVNRH